MRILITNYTLGTHTGTETFVRDLALGLRAHGHDPMVYSPILGALAQELRLADVPVVSDLAQLPQAPDLIHGHHLHETMVGLLRFPLAPGIFVVHDKHSWHDTPPLTAQVRRYVAVDQGRRDRLILRHGVPAERIQVIPNSVDTRRFISRQRLPQRPARALLFSNDVKSPRQYREVREACMRNGIELKAVGSGVKNLCAEPQLLLPGFDLVFAMGRSALEAMAAGTGVIVWGVGGLGGFVGRSNFESLMALNFGRDTLARADTGAIAAEIAAFDPKEAEWVRDRVRETCHLDRMVVSYLELYEEVLQECRAHPVSLTACLEGAASYVAECVPRVQVESLLGKRASKATRSIKKMADALTVLVLVATAQLGFKLVSMAASGRVMAGVAIAALCSAFLAVVCYVRTWLRSNAARLAQHDWRRLFYLE